jgi:hypothetical protein
MPNTNFDLRHLYLRYRDAIVRICVTISVIDEAGQGEKQSLGTGFHIGEGLIVTARHVANQTIKSITRESGGTPVIIEKKIFPEDCAVDLAILVTNFHKLDPPSGGKQKRIPCIPLGQYLDSWLGDDFILSKVLVMGYPNIPMSTAPFLVSAEAEVNAIIKIYHGRHCRLIVSSMARGGFSGGPIISAGGFLIGVVTESLVSNNANAESGFFTATSVEPLLRVLVQNNLGKDTCLHGDVWRLLTQTQAGN